MTDTQSLTVWGRRSSFNVQKVMWLIGELGLKHQHIELGGRLGGLNDPAFLKLNPHGRIPVLRDGDIVVWESHSILRYLAATYAQDSWFWPKDPGKRAQIEPWMDWSQTILQLHFLTGVFWRYYRTPENERNWPIIEENLKRCATHFSLLNEQLQNLPFLCGEHLTLADIPIGTCLYRYFELDIERPEIPHVERWYQRLQGREAYQQHVMIPFAEMKGRLD